METRRKIIAGGLAMLGMGPVLTKSAKADFYEFLKQIKDRGCHFIEYGLIHINDKEGFKKWLKEHVLDDCDFQKELDRVIKEIEKLKNGEEPKSSYRINFTPKVVHPGLNEGKYDFRITPNPNTLKPVIDNDCDFNLTITQASEQKQPKGNFTICGFVTGIEDLKLFVKEDCKAIV